MALSWRIYSLSLLLVVLVQQLVVARAGVIVGENYYLPITAQRVNWYRAYQICKSLGMQLASVETDSDLTELRQYLFDNSLLSSNYWLAGNNLADRASYVWLSTGRTLSYTNWAASQPGTLGNRCIRTNNNFDWMSDACTNANYFICSRPQTPYCGVFGGCTPMFSF